MSDHEAGPAEPPRPEALGAFIRDERRRSRLSMRMLARRSGVSNPYVSQIERGLRQPSAAILRRIAEALGISAESLYVRAGILEDRHGAPDVISAVLADPDLGSAQRAELLEAYDRLRGEAGTPLTEDERRRVDRADSAGAESPGAESSGSVRR